MEKDQKRGNCVVQCRVSSLKQQEGESLERQESDIRKFVADRGWHILPDGKVWSTAISGRKTDREDFEDIKNYIKKHPGLIDYYVFKSIDRATRAGSEEYSRMKRELAQYGVAMIDANGVIQPSINTLQNLGLEYAWSKYHPSEITENVLATVANQEVTNILTRMIGQEISLTQQGYRARRPLDGFLNQKVFVDGKKKTIQVPNPERDKFYIAMFNFRAQRLPDPEIVSRLNTMGYKSVFQDKYSKDRKKIIGRTGGLPLTVKQLQRIVTNTLYAGVVCEKWTHYKPIKAQYNGLVSIEKFNEANQGKLAIMKNLDGTLELIKGNPNSGKERMKHNPMFPFKFILCPHCNKGFLGSSPRGKSGEKFPTYHCARGHKYLGIPKNDFDTAVRKYIENLKFAPEIINGLEAAFLKKYQIREKEVVRASGDIHQNIANMELQQASKLEAFETTKSIVIRQKLEKEIDDLEVKIKTAGKERRRIQISRDDIKAFMRDAKRIMEHPAEMLLNQRDLRIQRDLFELVFEKMPTYSEILSGTPKLSYVFKLSSGFTPDENQLVTLMIPDSKPYVNFFKELEKIVSNFEKPLNYRAITQEVLLSSSLNGI